MGKKLSFGNVLVCDHAVPGARNKVTLVNVYSGDMIVEVLPATLMLGFYIELVTPKGRPQIDFSVTFDGAHIFGFRAEKIDGLEGELGTIIVQLVPCNFSGPGEMQIVATAPNFDSTIVLRKKVVHGTVPVA